MRKKNFKKCAAIVTVRPCENYTEILVKDSGIGNPKENQSRVFERFYRVDKGRLVE